MKNKNSGTGGVLALVAVVVILIILGRFTPAAAKTVLIVAAIVIAALVVLIIVGLFLAARDDKKKAAQGGTGKDLTEDQREMLGQGRNRLMELRRKIMRITTISVRTKANEICGIIDRIFQTLKDNPEKIPSVRQTLNYYLPTLGKVLEKYDRLEDSGTVSEETTAKVLDYLSDAKAALNRQYENLFESDKLDMTVEMEAMMLAAKRDGLIDEVTVTPEQEGVKEEDKITLKL